MNEQMQCVHNFVMHSNGDVFCDDCGKHWLPANGKSEGLWTDAFSKANKEEKR